MQRLHESVTAVILVACAVLAGGCASSNAVPRPFPAPAPDAASRGTDARSPAGEALADTALSFQGTPYRNGGADPAGFDCSGFVEYVFARHGVWMPRTVREQFAVGRKVRSDDLRPGDLVFFDTGSSPSHVGVMVGGDRFVHAPSSKGIVRVEHLGTRYWSERFVGARRVGDS
jgi:cell wall-associated NlpC family hydrolase